MTQRRRRLLVLGILAVLAFGVVVLFRCPPGRPSHCNYRQVRAGMTMADVQALLGRGQEFVGGGEDGVDSERRSPIDRGEPAEDVDCVLRWIWYDGRMECVRVGFQG